MGDAFGGFGFHGVEQEVVALHDGGVVVEAADFVGTDDEASGVFFEKGEPFGNGFAVFDEVGVKEDPGDVDAEVGVGGQHAVDFLHEGGDVHAAADAGVAPDEFGLGVLRHGFLELVQVDGFALPDGGGIGVDEDGEIELCGEVVDAVEGVVVGLGSFAVGEGGEIVMAGHHFADALPETGVPFDHAADVIHGVAIGAVEAADDGVEVLAVGFGEGLDLARDEHVGGGVPVAAGVVLKVILGLLGLGFGPLLDQGHAADDGIGDAGFGHGTERGGGAVGALEEIDQVQVAVGHGVAHGLRLHGHRRGGLGGSGAGRLFLQIAGEKRGDSQTEQNGENEGDFHGVRGIAGAAQQKWGPIEPEAAESSR